MGIEEWRRLGYSKVLMDHFLNPRNVGEIEDATVRVRVGSVACGDMIRMDMKIEGDRVVDVKFKSYGCAANVATASASTEYIKGKRISEVKEFSFQEILRILGGLPRSKMHCAVLAEAAIKACIAKYEIKEGKRKLDKGTLNLLLSGVIDPETGEGAIPSGKLKILEIEGKKVKIEVKGKEAEDIKEQVREALQGIGLEIELV